MINSINDLIPRFYKNEQEINWRNLSIEYQLSDDFVNKYQNKLDWEKLSMRHKISDNFLEIFEKRIIWSSIVFNPRFTYEFIIKYIHYLSHEDLNNYVRFNMGKLDKLQELRLVREIINGSSQ